MTFFSLSSLSRLDVRWANTHYGDRMFYESPHENPHYELLFVVDGPVYLQVEDRQLTLLAGEYIILEPWQRHWGWKEIGSQAGFFWVQFQAEPELAHVAEVDEHVAEQLVLGAQSDLRGIASNETKLILPSRGKPECRFEIAMLTEKIIAEMKRPRGYFRIRTSASLWTVLERIADDWLQREELDPATPASFALYRQIVNILDETYRQHPSKERLESALDRRYEYICAVFKRYSGMTITLYVHNLRMQRARYLLRSSGKSVTDIAYEVGYEDPYHFTKVFKKSTGLSPTEFQHS